MKRLLAMLLLVCFGITIPLGASPCRLCFLEINALALGFETYGETPSQKSKCCLDCGTTDDGDSCCVDIEKLPDAPLPSAILISPPILFCESNFDSALPPCRVAEVEKSFSPSAPIRGPDSPGENRAMLGIWRL